MPDLNELLDCVQTVTVGVRLGDGCCGALNGIEFLATAGPLRDDTVYLLAEDELPALLQRGDLPGAAFFVCCGGEVLPALPEEHGGACSFLFVRAELLRLYAQLNARMEAIWSRRRIDDILLMGEHMQYAPDQLLQTLSRMIDVGIYVLNTAFARICGGAPGFAGNPYVEELERLGALSAESVQRIRSGDGAHPALLHEAASSKWSRYNVLVLWHPGAAFDAEYFCAQLADYVLAYRARGELPDIPAFLVDQRLNRILLGRDTDSVVIRNHLGLMQGQPEWLALLVLGGEHGAHWSAEAYQRQAHLLRSAFRNVQITVLRGQICAVVRIPMHQPQDAVYSRSFFDSNAYAEGWDAAHLERELQQCEVYLCCSSIFQTLYFIPIECSMIYDTLDIAIKLDGCRGRRIVEFQEYHSYINVKYAVERFLQRYDARCLRSVLYPELVTLLLHDLKNHTDLSNVLYNYYIYGDVNRTAQSLFVHRNTVYNKLKTIQRLLDVDLDDPAVRASCLTSLQIYYYCEKCLGLDLHTI